MDDRGNLQRMPSHLDDGIRLVLEPHPQDLDARETGRILGVTSSNVRVLRHRIVAFIRAWPGRQEKPGGRS